MRKIVTWLSLITSFTFAHAALADSSQFGVIKYNSDTFKLFSSALGSPTFGELQDTQTFATVEENPPMSLYGRVKYEEYHVADVRSDTGAEWITFRDDEVLIFDQLGNQVDSFSPWTDDSVIAVGELSSDSTGPEIAVCKKESSIPRLRIFSYSEDEGAEKIKSIEVFNEKIGSCDGIGIGDTDGDSYGEVVAFGKERGKDTTVEIYNVNGEMENTFTVPDYFEGFDTFEDWPIRKVSIGDIDGDGTSEILFVGDRTHVYGYNQEGEELLAVDLSLFTEKVVRQLLVDDLDDDGKEDVVIQTSGRKVPIYILDEEGIVTESIQLFANTTTKAKRYVFLGDFSTEL